MRRSVLLRWGPVVAQEGGWGEGRQSCDVVGTAVLGEGTGGGAEEVSWGLLSWGKALWEGQKRCHGVCCHGLNVWTARWGGED